MELLILIFHSQHLAVDCITLNLEGLADLKLWH